MRSRSVHEEPLRKDTVRHAIADAVAELQRDDTLTRTAACDALGIGTAEWSACRDELIEELSEAEDWIEREDAIVESDVVAPPIDSDTGPEFLPSHPTLALVQSAMDEQMDATPPGSFHSRDPKWLSVLYQRLRAKARGKAPFVAHNRLDDFRYSLPLQASVALVSDWGTANLHARAVATEIARRNPDHVIHLGDVYYAGTPREVRRNFVDVWRAYGPAGARYWALNANHDMYSGGYGYFQHLLPAIGQPASYFNVSNQYWQIVGLDSAYVNHHIAPEQRSWLGAQLVAGPRTILLTHHHLLSPFRKRGDALEAAFDPHLASHRIYAWFWGHEHHLLEFADYRGVKCRCIGHGSLPYVPPDQRRRRHPAEVVRMETRPSSLNPSRGMHGFALLRFDGPALHIEYIDEEGGTAWDERWE
jgi:hypothetical protein